MPLKIGFCQVPMAHTCNPHYSEGLWLKASAGQIVHKTLSPKKKPSQEKRLVEWLKV
jgi:hypothetical protein